VSLPIWRTLRRPAGRSCSRWPGPLRWRRRARPRRRWRPEPRRPPVVPARLIRVPRSPAVVGTPVRSDRKGDHRRPASDRPRQIPGVDPAAPPAGDDVTPAPAVGAANHVDGRSWLEPGDQRKRAVRPGTHVHRLRGERRLRERRDRHQQRQRNETSTEVRMRHRDSPRQSVIGKSGRRCLARDVGQSGRLSQRAQTGHNVVAS